MLGMEGMEVHPRENDMALGSSLSPFVSNIFVDHFEKLAFDSIQHKQSLWLRYTDIFVAWPHDPRWLQNILSHLNSLRPSIQFAKEIESGSTIPFLDVLINRKGTTLVI
jgi:hypothetical protein